ncbi:pKID domain protein [Onchocerca flexuosa]|uniref:PKID domain protein n=1 Tax=Onchocerca flexuosa TaxID=387005 RepID=A0A238BLC4_9BILA|nr:pKID domain protein [Onchocerca flexuosa]
MFVVVKTFGVLHFQLKVLAKVILQNQSNDEIISDEEARRRREQLNRRPSYRKTILNLKYFNASLFCVEVDNFAFQKKVLPHCTYITRVSVRTSCQEFLLFSIDLTNR